MFAGAFLGYDEVDVRTGGGQDRVALVAHNNADVRLNGGGGSDLYLGAFLVADSIGTLDRRSFEDEGFSSSATELGFFRSRSETFFIASSRF